nr:YrzA family protein [Neobacillus sp. Marseille-Q6967]
MNFQIEFIEDKVEFFDANDLKSLEKKIEVKIDENKALMLGVHSVSHQMHVTDKGQTYFTAVVHFKLKK